MNISQYLNNKKTLIFDLDGVIIDSDKANFLAYRESVCLIKNIDLCSKNFNLNFKDRFTKETLLKILKLNEEEYNQIIKLKNILFKKYVGYVRLNSYILGIIKAFYSTKQIILATNANKERAISILRYLNIESYFDKKFFKEDYCDTNKYIYTFNKEHLEKKDVLIFEDNEKMIPQYLNLDFILIQGV